MGDTVIQVENLSKRYLLSHQQESRGYKSLRDVLSERAKSLVKPFSQGSKLKAQPALKEEFWALKEVSFEIKQGDRVGIIGRNGAGKSTLLKILSRIVEPTSGSIRIKGRVTSLLEVGTGFHPELTGRENIFLNGAILGMGRTEIQRKFDEIVDFAEVEKFLDTPVKRYSSGMYVRLAFAVAAHLEPEILIVDEVLAVGDAQFQKKCLGKMQDVSSNEGRTVLFVSHNMDAVQRLCSKCIMLKQGTLFAYDNTTKVAVHYLSSNFHKVLPNQWVDLSANIRRIGTGQAKFESIRFSSLKQSVGFHPYSDGPIEFHVSITCKSSMSVGSVAITLYDQIGNKLINADTISLGQMLHLREGQNFVHFQIDSLHLQPGIYRLGLWMADPIAAQNSSKGVFDHIEFAFEIEVMKLQNEEVGVKPSSDGIVTCDFKISQILSSINFHESLR